MPLRNPGIPFEGEFTPPNCDLFLILFCDPHTQTKIFEARYDADDLKKRKALILSGKRIAKTDGPDKTCTHDYLFEKDTIEIPNKRKNAKTEATRSVRVCVKCGRLNHSASRCTDSGANKLFPNHNNVPPLYGLGVIILREYG